jgi:hypothetical protein
MNERTSIFDEIRCVARLLLCSKRVCAQKENDYATLHIPSSVNQTREIKKQERKKEKKIKSSVVDEYRGRPRKSRKEETAILTFSQVELKIYDRHIEPC